MIKSSGPTSRFNGIGKRVRSGDLGAEGIRFALQYPVPDFPAARFKTETFFRGNGRNVAFVKIKGNAEFFTEIPGKGRVAFRFGAAYHMVDVNRGDSQTEFIAETAKKMQKGTGIRAAGQSDNHTVAGGEHGIPLNRGSAFFLKHRIPPPR